jgi:para-aminobenzoate synthetase component 1
VDVNLFKQKAVKWASTFDVGIVLDNNNATNAFGLHDVEFIAAAGITKEIKCTVGNAFESLKAFRTQTQNTLFGYFTYDLKNELEKLSSNHPNGLQFPDLYFFEPLHSISIDKNGTITGDQKLIEQIEAITIVPSTTKLSVNLKQRVSQDQYLTNVEQIRQHIIEGDVYELNYCVEFYSENALLDPMDIYRRLIEKSPTPFASFFKYYDQYLLCASPERFIKKTGDKLYSQPIKGTAKRGETQEEDEHLKQELLNSEKERAENLMIVDLVRNDLARSSKTGSIEVNELFGIYSFKQVHQMISTVSSVIREDIHVIDAIKHAFPMGSMTGAPKIMAMELIEKYETSKRGLYSGALGYIAPNGDVDFNVVIRSIQYNAATCYLSFEVGGAITFDSNPQHEYEECLLKAKAIMQVLSNY